MTLYLWTIERNAIRSFCRSFERFVEAEERVHNPSECDTSAELRCVIMDVMLAEFVENMVYTRAMGFKCCK